MNSPSQRVETTSASLGAVLERCAAVNANIERWNRGLDWNPFHRLYESGGNGWVTQNGRQLMMTGSSSYLGLSRHPRIRQAVIDAVDTYGSACHGSRALTGNKAIHTTFEKEIAEFLGADKALLFTNGWLTNYTVIATLMKPGDAVITDLKNHNCIASGIRASGARTIYFKADDPRTLKRALDKAGDATTLVVSDAVFSMEGTILPLPPVLELCREYGAVLMVDEAQSIGVIGRTGRGLTEHFGIDPSEIDIRTGTASKVLSASGGYVLSREPIVQALSRDGDGFLFTGAPSVVMAATALESLRILRGSPELVAELHAKTEYFRAGIRDAGFRPRGDATPIVPIVYDSEPELLEVVWRLDEAGIFAVPAVYPAVPKKSPRIRFNVTNEMSYDDMDLLIDTFTRIHHQVAGPKAVLDLTD
ncbi:MAG: aminotransferase class I/II-fold pyridoxal phosphate-dependent enzyme [Acidimicrobiia bacterium]|nr:aminotransferase class I/II-fold pyridoxal phosphate-dependent enzyme [Acidimicrobiia bacterium]